LKPTQPLSNSLESNLIRTAKSQPRGLTDKDIGTACEEAFAAGDIIAVRLRTASGTHKMIASEALAAGATVYTESDGEVQDTAQATAFQIGTALEAATADGDIIEVLYNSHGDTAAS
jgi:hypothetical protein